MLWKICSGLPSGDHLFDRTADQVLAGESWGARRIRCPLVSVSSLQPYKEFGDGQLHSWHTPSAVPFSLAGSSDMGCE